ncbi:hypothetical protein GYH30_017918 [Glycine max]|nr:hypothetical protein GYH30_017918 [Glycine max]
MCKHAKNDTLLWHMASRHFTAFPISHSPSRGILRVPIALPSPLPSKRDSASIQTRSSFSMEWNTGERNKRGDMEKRKRREEKEERGTDTRRNECEGKE